MARLTFQQVMDLWVKNGGAPSRARVMAAIAFAESGGKTDAHNPKPPDDSWGLWQINYYGGLRQERTSAYGAPEKLAADPNAQARAAIALSNNGENLQPWSTYTSGAYQSYMNAKGDLSVLPASGKNLDGSDLGGEDLGVPGADCLFNVPVAGCILKKSQAYAILGAVEIGAGATIILVGLTVLLGTSAARSITAPVYKTLRRPASAVGA